MNVLRSVFGWGGRLGRAVFFARLVFVLAALAIAYALLEPLIGTATVWLVNPPALWAILSAMARRLHDRGRAGVWLWVALVPILGASWLFWQCCRKGVALEGTDAGLGASGSRDFLVVGG